MSTLNPDPIQPSATDPDTTLSAVLDLDQHLTTQALLESHQLLSQLLTLLPRSGTHSTLGRQIQIRLTYSLLRSPIPEDVRRVVQRDHQLCRALIQSLSSQESQMLSLHRSPTV